LHRHVRTVSIVFSSIPVPGSSLRARSFTRVVGLDYHFNDHDSLIFSPSAPLPSTADQACSSTSALRRHSRPRGTRRRPYHHLLRPKSSAGSATNACSISMSQRIGIPIRQRIAECRQIRARYFQVRGPQQRRIHRSFGFGFTGFTCGGVNCVILNFGSLPLFTGVSV